MWLKGIIIALGRFKEAIIGLVIACYVISTPISVYLCFEIGLSIKGLWQGFMIGLLLLNIYYFYLIFCKFDWIMIADEALVTSNK